MKIHTYYDNLKIVRTAPIGVIKASYRALSQQHHPDKNNGSFESTHIMKIINKAYEVLSDPIQRAAYDEELRQKEAKVQQASSAQTKPPQSEPPAQEKPVKPPETPQSSQKGTGWVYILSNKTFPNLVKIGMTTKTPEERAKGLDNTGLPYRYVVEYKICVNNHHKLEQAVHRDMKYYREDKGKEFFRCTVEDAIKSINKIISNDTLNQYITPKKPVSQAEEANQWFKLGYAAYSKQDYQTAFNYYQKAAAQGDANAQCNLGYMYDANGHGVIKNESTAVEWYKKAAAQGHTVAQKNLLLIHEKNIKAQKEADFQKAAAAQKEAELQKAAAAQKEAELQKAAVAQKEAELQKAAAAHQRAVAAQKEVEQWFNLGLAAYNIQNYVVALDKFQKAANQGSAKAQYKLGVMYNNGYSIVKNERTAVEWFQKAADQGDAHAQYNLSLIHEKNIKAQKEAELQKAAAAQKVVNQAEQLKQDTMTKTKVYISSNKLNHNEQNDSWSNLWRPILVFIFFSVKIISYISYSYISHFTRSNDKQNTVKNEQTLVEWHQKVAEQNNASAQNALGYMYTSGKGVAKNESTAVEWYKKAAEQGHAGAQFNLGMAYALGNAVVKNESTAVAWYTKAAEQGFAQAQYNLGYMYANGQGVVKSERTAYFWWLLASASGDEYAKKNIRVIENKINSEEKQVAQDAAANWRPKQ